MKSVLLGSVSRAVLERANRPVLVVPGSRPEPAPGATLSRLGSFGLSATRV